MQTSQPGATPAMDTRNPKNLPRNAQGEREWSNGLFGCFGDCGTCCLSVFCPCMTYSKIKTRLGYLEQNGRAHPEGGESCSGDAWLYCCLQSFLGVGFVLQIGSRGSVRTRYNISGNGCGDCFAACCCAPCELTQSSREIELEEQSLRGKY